MKNRNKVYDSLILIMQFGINMIVPIFFFMYWTRGFIYRRYGHPWLVILLFFSLGRQRDSRMATGWHRGFGRKKTRERLNQMLKRINDALPELILGILIYEIVVEFTGSWFVKDKLGYSNGLLIEQQPQSEWQSIWQWFCGTVWIWQNPEGQDGSHCSMCCGTSRSCSSFFCYGIL